MKTPIAHLEQRFGLLRSQAIQWNPFRRRKLVKFYKQIIPQGSLCFDVGAHLGNRIDAWLALQTKIVALDPQPLCFKYLKRHFGKHQDVTILSKAAGAALGNMKMHISHLYPTISTLSGDEWQNALKKASNASIHWDESIDVEVITLDKLIDNYGMPHFCKIDVEGFETDVLKGLSKNINTLSFEFLSTMPEKSKECISMIQALGNYEFNWSEGDTYQFEFKKWQNVNVLLQNIESKGDHLFSGDIYAKLL